MTDPRPVPPFHVYAGRDWASGTDLVLRFCARPKPNPAPGEMVYQTLLELRLTWRPRPWPWRRDPPRGYRMSGWSCRMLCIVTHAEAE